MLSTIAFFLVAPIPPQENETFPQPKAIHTISVWIDYLTGPAILTVGLISLLSPHTIILSVGIKWLLIGAGSAYTLQRLSMVCLYLRFTHMPNKFLFGNYNPATIQRK